MNIPFSKYAKNKNKICISYLGPIHNFVIQLKYLRSLLKRTFTELDIYICCRDDLFHLISDESFSLPFSHLKKDDFCYIREVKYNTIDNPMLKILEESEISLSKKDLEFFQ